MAPSEQLHVHQQEYMHRAVAAYEDALEAYADAQVAATDLKVTLAQARNDLKDMEDEVIVNSGHGDHYVQANSADKRAAQARQALKHWPEYQAKRGEAAALERELGRLEAARDRAANTMSINKRRADAHVANVNREQVIKTLAGARRNGHG